MLTTKSTKSGEVFIISEDEDDRPIRELLPADQATKVPMVAEPATEHTTEPAKSVPAADPAEPATEHTTEPAKYPAEPAPAKSALPADLATVHTTELPKEKTTEPAKSAAMESGLASTELAASTPAPESSARPNGEPTGQVDAKQNGEALLKPSDLATIESTAKQNGAVLVAKQNDEPTVPLDDLNALLAELAEQESKVDAAKRAVESITETTKAAAIANAAALDQQLASLEQQLTSLEGTVAALTKSAADAAERTESTERALAVAQQTLNEHTASLATEQKEVERHTQLAELSRLEHAKHEHARSAHRAKSAAICVAMGNHDIESTTVKLEDARSSMVSASNPELRAALTAEIAALEAKLGLNQKLQTMLRESELALTRASELADAASQRAQEADASASAAKARCASLAAELSALNDRLQLPKLNLVAAQEAQSKVDTELRDAVAAVAATRDELAVARKAKADLEQAEQAEQAKPSPQLSAVRAVPNVRLPGLPGLPGLPDAAPLHSAAPHHAAPVRLPELGAFQPAGSFDDGEVDEHDEDEVDYGIHTPQVLPPENPRAVLSFLLFSSEPCRVRRSITRHSVLNRCRINSTRSSST
jgi:hypothetical protein